MKWKIVISLSVIGLILLFTNPTPTDFNTYLEAKNHHVKFGYGRKYNFLIFSIYTRNYVVSLPYLSPSVIEEDSAIAPIHITQEKYEQELKQFKKSRDSTDKICRLKGYWTLNELYKAVLKNKPDLTMEQFQVDMSDPKNSYKLWENTGGSGNKNVPSDYNKFEDLYEPGKIPSLTIAQEPITIQRTVYDTVYKDMDTINNYVGILKNFFKVNK